MERSIINTGKTKEEQYKYATEEMASNYKYPKNYEVKGITEQVAIICKLFPKLETATYDKSIALRLLPGNAEGWFAIPKCVAIGETYNDAVQSILDVMKEERKGNFRNWIEGKLDVENLLQSVRSANFWQQLEERQKGHDILIVPAQFGFHHRGRSIRRARAVFTEEEFGLGLFAVGIMLLTHPERVRQEDCLYAGCAGDEYLYNLHAPYFYFNEGQTSLSTRFIGFIDKGFGSVSAIMPK